MQTESAQVLFFKHIKTLLPPHLSLVDSVAEALNISNDSAYRRIRGETQISMEELKSLSTTFKISLDQLLHLNSDSFVFVSTLTNSTDFNYEKWLNSVLAVIRRVKGFNPCHMSYVAKEFPFFYYFLIPEIAAFKSFFFMKSILFYDDWKGARFSVKDDYTQYHTLWKDLFDTFVSIPGTEIWNVENITSTFRQIEFYNATGIFKSADDVACLFDKLTQMLDHVQLQAEYSTKLHLHENPSTAAGAEYNLYINELILGDNMQVMQLGTKYYTYLNHTILNHMMTTDERFNGYMKKSMDSIVQKSIPISGVNEKERLIFFNRLRAKLESARKKLFD
jgi:hypothetical protein